MAAAISSEFLLVFLVTVVYASLFWVQQVSLPVYVDRLQLDAETFGLLQSVFSALQLFGGPLFGRFADIYGDVLSLSLAFVSV
jgi:OCT family organic cation transporter-like MFS transporter 18